MHTHVRARLASCSAVCTLILAATAAHAGGPAGNDHGAPMSGPKPEQAWQWLREGNARFISEEFDRPNISADRRAAIAGSQSPFAIILSCSDSRVPAELLFDRGIGDLFVIRVAGNVADTDEIGTVEYGVGHLHAPLVVVMGHTACGAVKAVAGGAEVHGSIPGLVDNIIPAVEWVKQNRPELEGDELITAAIEANVWQSIDDLLARSSEVRGAVESGSTMVIGAVYDIQSGSVRWLGQHPYQDKLLSSAMSADTDHDAPMSQDSKMGSANKPAMSPQAKAPAHKDDEPPTQANVPMPAAKKSSGAHAHGPAAGHGEDSAKGNKPAAKSQTATGHDKHEDPHH